LVNSSGPKDIQSKGRVAVSPSIIDWYEDTFFPAWERAQTDGWDTMSRRDQILVGVGLLLDCFAGEGITASFQRDRDENAYHGLTRHIPDALQEVGLDEASGHVRKLLDEPIYSEPLTALYRLLDEWVPDGERVMLTRLFEWYHAQPA
jgi:hypothetical protein